MTISSLGLRPARQRHTADTRTRMSPPTPIPDESFADVFARIWPQLDGLYRSFPADGLLVVAVWRNQDLEAHLHVSLDQVTTDHPAFVVLGRHSACDLRLVQDDSISLRHLVVAAHRRGRDVQVRLLDLGTEVGIVTEDGQRCCGLGADGAAFVGLGGYKLFVLPTGSLAPLPWGTSAAEAWAAIPERVYVDRRTPGTSPDRAPRVRLMAPDDRGDVEDPLASNPRQGIATQILDSPTALREPRPSAGARGPRMGRLGLRAGSSSESYDVHAADLARGLLIGRYDRCALGSEDDRLSRVHLLLVSDGDTCWAIDTASTNGTTNRGDRIRHVPLRDAADLCLGRAIEMTWNRVGEPSVDRLPDTAV